MKMELQGFELELVDESGNRNVDVPGNKYVDVPDHWLPRVEHRYKYSALYVLGDAEDMDISYSPQCGVILSGTEGECATCIIRSSGYSLYLATQSVVASQEHLVLAIGDRICCLAIPTLALQWSTKVDTSCCFAVYASPDHKGFISHGELEITKVDVSGKVVWSVSGGDVFSGEFAILADHVAATDWNSYKYRIELSSGQVTVVKPGS